MASKSDNKSTAAFDAFRAAHALKAMPPERVANADQCRQMTEADGLRLWQDGSVDGGESQPKSAPPALTAENDADKMLWVVRNVDVPYAAETCPFGRQLKSRAIKHSNLTGGEPAFCGGELLILNEHTIVISGRSGRYGPGSVEELAAVAKAFRASGYHVWCMGYDSEVGYPLPFVGSIPSWVV
jgi:hypothetical protein